MKEKPVLLAEIKTPLVVLSGTIDNSFGHPPKVT